MADEQNVLRQIADLAGDALEEYEPSARRKLRRIRSLARQDAANSMLFRRCLTEIREVAEQAIADGVALDPEWLHEHVSIALDHPVEVEV